MNSSGGCCSGGRDSDVGGNDATSLSFRPFKMGADMYSHHESAEILPNHPLFYVRTIRNSIILYDTGANICN